MDRGELIIGSVILWGFDGNYFPVHAYIKRADELLAADSVERGRENSMTGGSGEEKGKPSMVISFL